MTHYRKVDVRIWNDEKFVSLTPLGKLAFLMVLTHPMMTALGAMRGTPGGVVDELCCGDEGLREGFREGLADIITKGMAEHDPKASLIALPNFVKYNPPESPNVVKAWIKAAEMLPEGDLKALTLQRAVGFAEGLSKGFREAIPEAFRKGMNKTSPKASPKTSPNQRAESSDEVRYEERLDPTRAHAREPEPDPPSEWPLDPFETEAEGRDFLVREGLWPPEVNQLLPILMRGALHRSQIQQAKARRRT